LNSHQGNRNTIKEGTDVFFGMDDLVPPIIEDYKDQIKDGTNKKVELTYTNDVNLKNIPPIIVEADKERGVSHS
jgi:hypothetical protein